MANGKKCFSSAIPKLIFKSIILKKKMVLKVLKYYNTNFFSQLVFLFVFFYSIYIEIKRLGLDINVFKLLSLFYMRH